MIKIENFETSGWEAAIRGMRNPMNSWDKSDSLFHVGCSPIAHDILKTPWQLEGSLDEWTWVGEETHIKIGEKDLTLMNKLAKAGSVDAKFRRFIIVTLDITAPLYWWKEFDTYRVGVAPNPTDIEYNSCSTMHKVHVKEFTLDDFSCEHLMGEDDLVDPKYRFDPGTDIALSAIDVDGNRCYFTPKGHLYHTCQILNRYREKFLETKDKAYWWQMIQLLPISYNQRRSILLNYEVLANIYQNRKNHKLDEWRDFCKFIEELPYAAELITLRTTSSTNATNGATSASSLRNFLMPLS